MKFSTSLLTGAFAFFTTASASAIVGHDNYYSNYIRESESSCITPGVIPNITGSQIRNVGVVLFQAFDMIDVFGPLDPLQLLSLGAQQLNLHLIAETLDPVTTAPIAMNKFNSSFFPVIPPTNTFDDDLDLDLLIVPGGPGARNPNLQAVTGYIAKMYPKVKVLMTICTGAGVAARAGVLDGHMATTNKNAWAIMKEMGPKVNWVSPARYVIDGKVWSSSGVSSSSFSKAARARFSNPNIVLGHLWPGSHLCFHQHILGQRAVRTHCQYRRTCPA
jgi:putative intracellular protease/amidase